MHFVLWGTSQPNRRRFDGGLISGFNALRALGYFSTAKNGKAGKKEKGFNALRALGYFSTAMSSFRQVPSFVSMHFVLWGTSQHRFDFQESTRNTVSMHFVLWGTSQLYCKHCIVSYICFNALRALGYFSTKLANRLTFVPRFNALRALGYFSTPISDDDWMRGNKFQCTSCFGVLLNIEHVQFLDDECLFQCTSCFGVLLNK